MSTKPYTAMIPSGYKSGKLYSILPNDGNQDFTLSRESLGTRIDKNGIIKEEINLGAELITNPTFQFNTDQGVNNVIDWNVNNSAGSGAQTSFNSSGYVNIKSTDGTFTEITIAASLVVQQEYRFFYEVIENNNGSLALFEYQNQTRKIPSTVGKHYFDFTSNSSTVFSIKRFSGVTDIKIQSASVKLITNSIPRLDYKYEKVGVQQLTQYTPKAITTCPSVLCEVSRTNFANNSKTWDSPFATANVTKTTTTNIVAPDGQNYGVIRLKATGTSQPRIEQGINLPSGKQNYAWSVYVKKDTTQNKSARYVGLSHFSFNGYNAIFDIEKGEIVTQNATSVGYNAKIESCINGWYRITLEVHFVPGGTNNIFKLHLSTSSNFAIGTVDESVLCWGPQIEVGRGSTSYIPTDITNVTRLKDNLECSNTFRCKDNKATFYFDFTYYSMNSAYQQVFAIRNTSFGSSFFLLTFQNGSNFFLRANVLTSSGTKYLLTSTEVFIKMHTRNRVAFSFDGVNYKIAVNRTVVKSGTLTAQPLFLTDANLVNDFADSNNKPSVRLYEYKFYDGVYMQDTELQNLTAL